MVIQTATKKCTKIHSGQEAKTLKTIPLSCDTVNSIPCILSKHCRTTLAENSRKL